MDNELEVIRHQMEETRCSLADKLEALENQFLGTVETATTTVAHTVETVQETVETVKESLDLRKHVERHPWGMVGGAVGVGFVAGLALGPSSPRPAPEPEVKEAPPAFVPHHVAGNGRNGTARHVEHAEAEGPLQSGLRVLKTLALGATMGVLRKLVLDVVPQAVAGDVKGWVDDVTTRLGGKPLDDETESEPEPRGEARHVERDVAEVGGPLGAGRWPREDAVGRPPA